MGFVVREIAGWLLIGLGLLSFLICYDLLREEHQPAVPYVERGTPFPQIINAGPLMIIGIILFRGGLHLLKVAVAARLSLKAQQMPETSRRPAPSPPRPVRVP